MIWSVTADDISFEECHVEKFYLYFSMLSEWDKCDQATKRMLKKI